ncbi:MAG: hypothetical protein AAGF30_01375 [Pseudomonadota bacterium]
MAQSNDIEDVLSSIRRLVATDPVSSAVTARPKTSSALLLQPANRVSDPEDPFQTVPVLPDQEDQGSAHDLQTVTEQDTSAPSAHSEDEAEDMAGLAQAERDARDATQFLTGMDSETTAITVDLADDPAASTNWSAPMADTASEAEVYLEDTDYIAASEIAADAPLADDAAAQGNAPDSDHNATTTAEEDEIDLSDMGPDIDEVPSPLDDEALRDLIAEIVRQELAGDLGERITRNVRKLVRREIRQMMSSEEFD